MSSSKVYLLDYYGFVYIWKDSLKQRFYIGSHLGSTSDSYIGSNTRLKAAHKKRPHAFKRRVISYLTTQGQTSKETLSMLHQLEQKWLDLIHDSEISISANVINGTCRYYNMKKLAAGGSHKGHTKRKVKPTWNIGVTKQMLHLRREGLFCLLCDKPKVIRNNKSPKLKKPKTRTRRLPIQKKCLFCETVFTAQPKGKFCSRSCSSKHLWVSNKARPHFVKSQPAWNKGRQNPTASINGKKGALKQSQKVTGRRMKTNLDGTRTWIYPADS